MERRPAAQYAAKHPRAALRIAWLGQHGTSLVELLVSTVFVSVLTAISYSFARGALMSARLQEVKSEAQQVTVMALDMLARDLRMAGFSAAGKPLVGLRAATQDRVEVACDLNGDGDTADSNEVIAYGYSEDKHQVTRATGGGSPQPLVRNVPSGGLRFSYFDAGGVQLAAEGGGATAEECRRIHRIDVLLSVQLANPDPNVAAPLTSTVSSSVSLRNQ